MNHAKSIKTSGKSCLGCFVSIVIFLFAFSFLAPLLGVILPFGFSVFLRALLRDVLLVSLPLIVFLVVLIFPKRKTVKSVQQNNSSEETETMYQNERDEYKEELKSSIRTAEHFDSPDVQQAFRILGLRSNVSYTKVSERYYELVQKVNKMKISEEKRQMMLEELAKAYEILTEYYSKMS